MKAGYILLIWKLAAASARDVLQEGGLFDLASSKKEWLSYLLAILYLPKSDLRLPAFNKAA